MVIVTNSATRTLVDQTCPPHMTLVKVKGGYVVVTEDGQHVFYTEKMLIQVVGKVLYAHLKALID